jgi:ferric-dicitrate binding protein FerR (iron transport regulator)
MNEENNLLDDTLVSKYLGGEANHEEAMRLHELLKNQDCKQEYDKICQLWERLPDTSVIPVPLATEEWVELDKKIKHSKNARLRKFVLNRIVAAASIVGLIVIVSYTWFHTAETRMVKNNEQLDIIQSAEDVVKTDTLPDGSIIIMNQNSSISYARAFNTNRRELALSGECYFNVIPDKTRLFVIAIQDLKIEVVGTSFNVRNNSSNGSIEVQVKSGTVKMNTAQDEITVITGQTGVYSSGALNVKDTLDVNSISYATKTFSFNDLSFADACHYLEKAFNIVIKFDNLKFSNCRLSAEFHNKSLDYILDIITATLNGSFKKQANTVYILGEGCK